jgi:hypothetical protein
MLAHRKNHVTHPGHHIYIYIHIYIYKGFIKLCCSNIEGFLMKFQTLFPITFKVHDIDYKSGYHYTYSQLIPSIVIIIIVTISEASRMKPLVNYALHYSLILKVNLVL